MNAFEAAYSDELTKCAGIPAGEAESLLSSAGKGLGKLFDPGLEAGKSWGYSLKLHPGAGNLTKAFHYGVTPALLGANVYSDVKAIRRATNTTTDDLVDSGLSPAEAVRAQREIRGAAIGRAVGDALGWSVYPLSLANPVLHHGVQLGANLGLPTLGEQLGKRIA